MAEIEKTEIVEIVSASRAFDNAKLELAAAQEAITIAERQLKQKRDHFEAISKRVSEAESRIRKLAKTL